MAGYSKRSLLEKLGIKDSFRTIFINPPAHYQEMLNLPPTVNVEHTVNGTFDLIQLFTKEKKELESYFPRLKPLVKPAGFLWISWPKGTAKISTNLTENTIRKIGLAEGLVDIKVIAIDNTWSGLKFVYRLKDRA